MQKDSKRAKNRISRWLAKQRRRGIRAAHEPTCEEQRHLMEETSTPYGESKRRACRKWVYDPNRHPPVEELS